MALPNGDAQEKEANRSFGRHRGKAVRNLTEPPELREYVNTMDRQNRGSCMSRTLKAIMVCSGVRFASCFPVP